MHRAQVKGMSARAREPQAEAYGGTRDRAQAALGVQGPSEHADFIRLLHQAGAPLSDGIGRRSGSVLSVGRAKNAQGHEHEARRLASALQGVDEGLALLCIKVEPKNDG